MSKSDSKEITIELKVANYTHKLIAFIGMLGGILVSSMASGYYSAIYLNSGKGSFFMGSLAISIAIFILLFYFITTVFLTKKTTFIIKENQVKLLGFAHFTIENITKMNHLINHNGNHTLSIITLSKGAKLSLSPKNKYHHYHHEVFKHALYHLSNLVDQKSFSN